MTRVRRCGRKSFCSRPKEKPKRMGKERFMNDDAEPEIGPSNCLIILLAQYSDCSPVIRRRATCGSGSSGSGPPPASVIFMSPAVLRTTLSSSIYSVVEHNMTIAFC